MFSIQFLIIEEVKRAKSEVLHKNSAKIVENEDIRRTETTGTKTTKCQYCGGINLYFITILIRKIHYNLFKLVLI